MNTFVLPREYKRLLGQKKKADNILRLFVMKHMDHIRQEADLKELAKLGITGGPRDLSTRLDFYLYQDKK